MKTPASKTSQSERDRQERQAQALRDNLLRRKTQKRGRKETPPSSPLPKGDPEHG